jgi:anti-sigma factor RsiW
MSCSPFDLRDYFLKELSDAETKQVENHTKTCSACREELERLRVTQQALLSLGDEEIPQRLAFVSDRVFDPSPWQRVWSAIAGSRARLGYASAMALSLLLLAFTMVRQATLEQRISQIQRDNLQVQQELKRAADSYDYTTRQELFLERSSYGERQ